MFLYESICLCVLAGTGNDIDAVDLQVIKLLSLSLTLNRLRNCEENTFSVYYTLVLSTLFK